MQVAANAGAIAEELASQAFFSRDLDLQSIESQMFLESSKKKRSDCYLGKGGFQLKNLQESFCFLLLKGGIFFSRF